MAKGKVGRLMKDRGYGFITTEDGKDVFFHRTGLQGITFESLKDGQALEFKIEEGPKGPRAIDITQSEESEAQSEESEEQPEESEAQSEESKEQSEESEE